MFVFGDSYSTKYLDVHTMKYADPDQMSSTNGLNWVDYFTQQTRLEAWDLAYNSAPVSNALVHQHTSVTDVSQQITQLYAQYFLDNKNRSSDETFYVIWVGINDLGLMESNDLDMPLTHIMERYKDLVDYLLEHHARHFIFINVPPIEVSPKWKPNAAKKMSDLVHEYNLLLDMMVHQLQHEKDGFFHYVDAWALFDKMLKSPDAYDFTNTTSYCPDWRRSQEHGCGPVEGYFWLNDLHPTTHVHKIFAQQLALELGSL
ncbi:hypothetical protein DM01DRAFT_1340549 [Hesseltinella vesiculosa]|uniref:Carbohydrate esterase family 16 protein n=1 Tax=Hesseltinella vesiculosa TaxID=101127 RepID=A0A1X2G3N0_9FUNG|nr:hypothetical protein DM01DRAFT_1340549 [Hesseltinella vesiculosa]